MENDTKSYESYLMMAKLLNSKRKENIDKAYDALLKALDESYKTKSAEISDDYTKKKNALAANKAKAEKYLNYFVVEKGYDGSGIEADAKLKSELAYNSDMASLEGAENKAQADLLSKQLQEESKNEAGRVSKKEEADGAFNYQLMKLKQSDDKYELDKMRLENDRRFKESQTEQKLKDAKEKGIAEARDSQNKTAYEWLRSEFGSAKDSTHMQSVYNAVTGDNTQYMKELLGEENYKKLTDEMDKKLKETREKEGNERNISGIIRMFEEASENEYHGQTYMRLKKMIENDRFPGYTMAQLDEAYKRYKDGAAK